MYALKINVKSNQLTVINMQKIVGMPEMEHFPTVGIVNEINLDYLVSPIETMQRDVSVTPFVLSDYKGNNSQFKTMFLFLKQFKTLFSIYNLRY